MSLMTIHPTTHAIDRFEQRVLPHLPEGPRTHLEKRENIRQGLYALARRSEISEESTGVLHVTTFFTIKGYHPIPITLVMDLKRSTIITLYIAPFWENIGTSESPMWRMYA